MKKRLSNRAGQAADSLLTERALIAARDARLGPLERSLRINRDNDARWKANGILILFVAPLPFFAMAYLMPEPWWGKMFTLAVGLAILLLGLLMFAHAVSLWHSGLALAHFFASGLVLERAKGDMLALRYDRIQVDYVTWKDTTNDSEHNRTQLWIKYSQDGVAVIDACSEVEQKDLSWAAERFGCAGVPRQIEPPAEELLAW